MNPKTGKVLRALKINKQSQTIKKSSVSRVQHKEPVIIYTQSPRIIQTHPRHFRELVQKLTGICRSDLDDDTAIGDADAFKPATPPLKRELKGEPEENEATASVSTDEEDGCNMGGEVKSNYNNFSMLESDFLNDSSHTPLLHFADLYGSL
ncbi:uncharacterized protein LOC124843905 [Vigna umbellata]|uniref:uncharacterized protein LOC124843905 n=1 Tax=Vigna umbellata TaxID=87088 RepID=UPI001F5E67E4|nr:uncharacterized protein LOC124843905 [Vigna umbellata]